MVLLFASGVAVAVEVVNLTGSINLRDGLGPLGLEPRVIEPLEQKMGYPVLGQPDLEGNLGT